MVSEVKTSLVSASSAKSGGKAIYLIPKKLEDDFISDLLHECSIETELPQQILFRLLRNDTPMEKLKALHFSTEAPALPALMIFCCDTIPLILLVSMGYIIRARNFIKSLARSLLTFGRRENDASIRLKAEYEL
ncbi:hypothetical protein [Pseudomonas rustica]|uniref:Uncharacterized protein n=1 Tax=Pseudomonas rustica TaxID=2827099 RepID=A0ABS5N3N7_9PSED|nr:hypothetical protein [Pseudomonas rustica]MBS4081188.1 hypothetical protein [Pseudomonas rustica]